jgi:hypothetical protein
MPKPRSPAIDTRFAGVFPFLPDFAKPVRHFREWENLAKSLKQCHKSLCFKILGRRVLCQPAPQFGKVANYLELETSDRAGLLSGSGLLYFPRK